MKTLLGLACLVAAILLTPDAWDTVANGSAHAARWEEARHIAPAAIAWVIGLWLVATRPKPDT